MYLIINIKKYKKLKYFFNNINNLNGEIFMPRFDTGEDSVINQTLSGYQFTAVDINQLDDFEYTLVNIAVDQSGSVSNFKSEMEKCLSNIVDICKKSHSVNKILFRLTGFNDSVFEIHGEKMLRSIDNNDYKGSLICRGMTAVKEATLNAIEYCEKRADELKQNDMFTNAVIYIITDGDDNASRGISNDYIKNSISRIRNSEKLTSLTIVLVGVNTNENNIKILLNNYNVEAGFDAYIDIGSADASTLGKLGELISQSISSASQNIASTNTPNVSNIQI